MSTVKISQLPEIPGGLNANTSNSLFLGVDIPTGITGKFTATQLAERLYANNVLNVGDNPVVLPSVVAQFAGDAEEYLQINLFNSTANGSADYVATADTGTDTTHYINLGINNSNYGTGALDGYVVVAGDAVGDPGGNLMIGSITSGKEIDFVIGGFEAANVVAKMIDDTGFRLTKKPIIFADGSSQNTAAASASFSQEAFATANVAASNTVAINILATAAYGKANAEGEINNTQNTNIISVNTFAQEAFTKANNALSNTSGIFGGSLTVSGNYFGIGTLNQNNYVTIANSTFDSANHALIRIIGSGGGAIQEPANPGYMLQIVGLDGIASRIINTGYGTGAYGLYAGRHANGTAASPTAAANNDILARIAASGYIGTQFTATGQARIDFVASENYSSANQGSRVEIWNTINGTNTISKIATFNASDVTFTGAVSPQKGFIYTPNTQGTLTTVTLDFARDSLIRFDVNTDATITPSNFVYGKVVEVWIRNTAAQNKVITHGCFANGSTSHATTFTIQAQSCAYLRYFSVDGDLANTFVSITA